MVASSSVSASPEVSSSDSSSPVSSSPAAAEKPPISPAKLRANRANARKSTGPRTVEGKIRLSKNALVHGLRSADILVEGEDPRELAAYRISIIRSTNPRNAMEMELVDQIIRDGWKLRRYQSAEVAAFHDRRTEILKRDANTAVPSGFLLASLMWNCKHFPTMYRYEHQYTRSMSRALADLRRLQAEPLQGCLGDLAGELIREEEEKLRDEPDEPIDETENAPNEPTADDRDVSDEATDVSATDGAPIHTDGEEDDEMEASTGWSQDDPPNQPAS